MQHFFFSPLAKSVNIQIFIQLRDRQSLEQIFPKIFIEQEDKKAGSALCPLGLKWPEEHLMKWNKLLWLSSLAAAVEERQGEGESPRKLTKLHITTQMQNHSHTQIYPSLVLPRSVFIPNHNRGGR